MIEKLILRITAALFLLPLLAGAAQAQGDLGKYADFTPFQERWLTTEPGDPSEEWLIAYGGRLYDNWIELVARAVPDTQHPSYPASGKSLGPNTWRCKECHGWDYNGKDGAYGNPESSHYTGIKGIRAFDGGDPLEVVKILRDETHGFDQRMLPKYAAERIALFVTRGQVRIEDHMNADGSLTGDPERGRRVFQNLCAVCHGYDGRSINFGGESKPKYLGHVASGNPQETLHKARNGHPGAIMPAQIWVEIPTLIDVISYAQKLPQD